MRLFLTGRCLQKTLRAWRHCPCRGAWSMHPGSSARRWPPHGHGHGPMGWRCGRVEGGCAQGELPSALGPHGQAVLSCTPGWALTPYHPHPHGRGCAPTPVPGPLPEFGGILGRGGAAASWGEAGTATGGGTSCTPASAAIGHSVAAPPHGADNSSCHAVYDPEHRWVLQPHMLWGMA